MTKFAGLGWVSSRILICLVVVLMGDVLQQFHTLLPFIDRVKELWNRFF